MIASAKNVKPSMSAAAMIMAVWILPSISGWRAMLSTAPLASLPIPSAAPRITMPAPMAFRSENGAALMRAALGKRRAVGHEEERAGQDDRLDQLHLNLNS